MKRLDQFGYRRLGAKSRWVVGEAVDMLTCFEMEMDQGYEGENPRAKFNKLHDIYWAYVTDKMVAGKLTYISTYTDMDRNNFIEHGADVERSIREHSTSFDRDTLLKLLEEDVLVRVDLHRLRDLLSGAGNLNVKAYHEESAFFTETVRKVGLGERIPADDNKNLLLDDFEEDFVAKNEGERDEPLRVLEDHRLENSHCITDGKNYYTFIKNGLVWNIQFESAILRGVKDWVGMSYIKILLQNPGVKFNVLDLQGMSGYDGVDRAQELCDYQDDDCDAPYGGVNAWEELDDGARKAYRNRLEEIAGEVKSARKEKDQAKIDALIAEAEFIRDHVEADQYRPKDPELEKNRKKVLKSITDTIKKIENLEASHGYNDTPISKHLDEHIKTGVCCSYNIEPDQLPNWRF